MSSIRCQTRRSFAACRQLSAEATATKSIPAKRNATHLLLEPEKYRVDKALKFSRSLGERAASSTVDFMPSTYATTSSWMHFILCSEEELNLQTCIEGGQTFTWTEVSAGEWANVVRGYLVTVQRNCGNVVLKIAPAHSSVSSDVIRVMRDYFRLDDDLKALYLDWARRDPNFAAKSFEVSGVRLLRQDPTETLFAFICSQNNGIIRIGRMVKHLALAYGQYVGSINERPIHSFPRVEADLLPRLATIELDLRAASFGYRAKHISRVVRILARLEPSKLFESSQSSAASTMSLAEYLDSLRAVGYEKVIDILQDIPGVGPKVADCVALMSLDKLEAVPIDTHILRVAAQNYQWAAAIESKLPIKTTQSKHNASSCREEHQKNTGLKKSSISLTRSRYRKIGDNFRSLFGPIAGWAHLVGDW